MVEQASGKLVRKVLKCKERRLGIVVPSTKGETAAGFPPEESSAVLRRSLARRLRGEGWNELREGLLLRGDFLGVAPGQVTECMAVGYTAQPGAGGDTTLTVSPGMGR